MKKSKWVILSIILILILIVGFISIYLWKKSDSSYEIEKVTEIKYNLINENKKIWCNR